MSTSEMDCDDSELSSPSWQGEQKSRADSSRMLMMDRGTMGHIKTIQNMVSMCLDVFSIDIENHVPAQMKR
jgi:hypothetical protein